MKSRSFLISAILIIVLHAASANDQRAPQRQRRRYAAGPSVIEGAGSAGRMLRPRNKRMYALCPPQFQRIGNECYYMSKEKANWLDAQFKCQDMDSKLAEPNKVDDRRLRKYFHGVAHDRSNSELWLGGKYDWQHRNWLWGYNGRKMKYQAFGKHQEQQQKKMDLQHHCTIMSRAIKFRWSPAPCMEEHFFICQHRMPVVNKNNLQHIYNMWNNTFPNQIANEIEVIFTNKNGGDLSQRFRVGGGEAKEHKKAHHGKMSHEATAAEKLGPAQLRKYAAAAAGGEDVNENRRRMMRNRRIQRMNERRYQQGLPRNQQSNVRDPNEKRRRAVLID